MLVEKATHREKSLVGFSNFLSRSYEGLWRLNFEGGSHMFEDLTTEHVDLFHWDYNRRQS